MHRFKNILLIDPRTPGRSRAFETAHSLATRNGGRLTVLAVIEREAPSLIRVIGTDRRDDLRREKVEAAREELAVLAESGVAEGAPVTLDAAVESPFIEINRRVVRDGHDLVMIAAEGQEGSWWGSTATHLLRKCPVPVWVMRPEPVGTYERILVAIDPEDEEPEAQSLARRLLQISSSLAHLHNAQLHVVSVWHVFGESLLRGRLGYGEEGLERIRAETRADHEAHLAALLEDLPPLEIERRVHLERGEASVVIARVAAEVDADMLVMGTVGRTGVQGLLIGNTAENVLSRVACPLIAVKPEGFQSPFGWA